MTTTHRTPMKIQMIRSAMLDTIPESQRRGVAHRVGCGDITRRIAKENKAAGFDSVTVDSATVIGDPEQAVWATLADYTEDDSLFNVASRVKVCNCLRDQGGKKAFMNYFTNDGSQYPSFWEA